MDAEECIEVPLVAPSMTTDEDCFAMDDVLEEYARSHHTLDEEENYIGEVEQEILRAARLYSLSVLDMNTARCAGDWLYCLFYNYANAQMDEQLDRVIHLLLRKYSLEDLQGEREQTPGPREYEDLMNPVSRHNRRFVTQTLHYVRTCKNVPAKQFLVLAVLAREPELQAALRLTCPDRRIDDLLAILPALAEHITNLPFNRGNVAAYLTQFLRSAKDAYFKGAISAQGSPALHNLQRSGKLSIESVGV